MKKYIVLSCIIFICCLVIGMFFSNKYIIKISNIKNNNEAETLKKEKNEDESIVVVLEKKEDIKVKITAIGDIMCHNSQYKDAFRNGTYDFSYVFEDIKTYIQNSDIAIGNLETTFAGAEKGYSSYPRFNTPEILAQNLKDLGIDVLSTANNHSLDTGYIGLENTIDCLDKVGILHTGTFKSEEKQNEIVTKEANGLKIAFLSYTYGTNGIAIPKGKEFCINLIDKELIINQLELVKKEKVDVICVNMHWGTEYEKNSNDVQKELANFLFENGVDIILGSHPHVLQPMEKRKIFLQDGNEKEVFVIYSLGNFMSGQTKENTRNSIILNFEIIKDGESNKINIDNISYVPIYTYTNPNYKNYKIIDIEKAILKYESGEDMSIGENGYNLLKNEINNVNLKMRLNIFE